MDAGASPGEESDGSWSAIGLQSAHGARYIFHEGPVTTDMSARFETTAPQ